jgi:hypothetical protein
MGTVYLKDSEEVMYEVIAELTFVMLEEANAGIIAEETQAVNARNKTVKVFWVSCSCNEERLHCRKNCWN